MSAQRRRNEGISAVVYAAWRFPNALQAYGTGSYGSHSGVQLHSNT